MKYNYLGTVDDQVIKNPWQNYEASLDQLNNDLIGEVLIGNNILINDGYLLNSELLRTAIVDDRKSPLLSLIRSGYITILSRTNKKLYELPEFMADQGNRSFQELLQSKHYNQLIKPQIVRIHNELSNHNALDTWPNFNISDGFIKLLKQFEDINPSEVGLKRTTPEVFNRVLEQYHKLIAESQNGPRDKFEKAIDFISPPPIVKQELMNLVNSVYQYNFSACYSAYKQEEFGDLIEIGLTSKYVTKLEGLLEEPKDLLVDPHEIPQLRLPKRLPLANGEKLTSIVKFGTELYTLKEEYKRTLANVYENKQDIGILKEVSQAYSRKLSEHFYSDDYAWFKKYWDPASIFTTPIIAPLLGEVSGLVVSSVATAFTTRVLVPKIIKRISIRDRKFFKSKKRSSTPTDENSLMFSLSIRNEKARSHAEDLQKF